MQVEKECIMDQRELSQLVQFFKGLADENRLRIIGFISHHEHAVGELATALEISEPTVSHHLSKLRELGLVNLRARGNHRFYRLNPSALADYMQQASKIDQLFDNGTALQADSSWIDQLDIDEFDRKVLKDYTSGGRLKQIPTKQKKLLAVLHWLATMFEPDVNYTERDVNAIITQVHDDYASLRRDLIEFGFLRRERGGGKYWLTPEDE
jgi:predicted transcriptional regulator